jgi:hypothetical protein
MFETNRLLVLQQSEAISNQPPASLRLNQTATLVVPSTLIHRQTRTAQLSSIAKPARRELCQSPRIQQVAD